MEISKEDLAIVFKVLLDKYFEEKKSLLLNEDLYWRIPVDELYYFDKDPATFTIGQLTDDAQELLKISKDASRGTIHDLYKLSSIIRYMSDF